jgi:carbonic anhydrase
MDVDPKVWTPAHT